MNTQRKTAIVTGSATGIGAACATHLAAAGFNVIVNYTKSEKEARETADACARLGAKTLLVQADVSRDEDCRRMAATAVQAWGRIDVLVNSAGSTKLVPHHDLDGLSFDDFQRIYAVNCIGSFQMTRACAAAMKAVGAGAVVNISAIAGKTGAGSSIAYAASKGALNTMTLSLARALGPEIRVNAVCPGLVESRWMHNLHGDRYDAFKAEWEDVAALASTATPDNVAQAALWFATGASQITGQCLVLDSGFTLGRPAGRPARV